MVKTLVVSDSAADGGCKVVASLVLIGGAIFLGDAVPAIIRILMFIGGVALVFDTSVQEGRLRRDPNAEHPYPAQGNVFGDRERR